MRIGILRRAAQLRRSTFPPACALPCRNKVAAASADPVAESVRGDLAAEPAVKAGPKVAPGGAGPRRNLSRLSRLAWCEPGSIRAPNERTGHKDFMSSNSARYRC